MSETVCRSGPDADSHGRCLDSKVSQVNLLSRVRLFSTPWTVAYQAPPSMGFSRQEYWSGVPFPSPEDLSKPGIEPKSPTLQADSLPSEPPGKPYNNTGVGSHSFLQGNLPNPGIEPKSPTLQMVSLPAESPGKPKTMPAAAAAVAAKSFQSCPSLCDPMDGSPPGSAVSGILQPRTLEWVAISFSNA